ncbi:class I adenylate-forming enzyme family protein [Thermoproteota archaeon]
MKRKLLLTYLKVFQRLNTPSRIINFAFKRHRDKIFIIEPDRHIRYSLHSMIERARKLIQFFYSSSLKHGNVIAFLSHNCSEYFEIRTAAHMGGFVFFGIPQHLSQSDIIYFLKKTHAKLIFYRKSDNLDMKRIEGEVGVQHCIDLDGSFYSEIFNRELDKRQLVYSSCRVVTLNLSSGTTQKTSKIVAITARNWIGSLFNYILNANIEEGKQVNFLCTLPFVTAGSTSFLPTMLAGMTNVVISGEFSPQKVVTTIKRCEVNRLYITPSWLIELLDWCQKNGEKLKSLDNIVVGTERMPPVRLKEAVDFFGPKITVGYGMVEVLPPITMLSGEDYFSLDHVRSHLFASVGKVLKGVKVKIVNSNLKGVRHSIVGKIVIKSNTVSKGYLDNFPATKAHFKHGWFFTNDYGYFDEDGFLFVLGRESEIIARLPRGKLLFSKEAEDRVHEIDFVKRCCLVSHDKKTVLFVSLRKDMDQTEAKREIMSFCKKNINVHIIPKRIIVKANLPITPLGKLDRKALESELG